MIQNTYRAVSTVFAIFMMLAGIYMFFLLVVDEQWHPVIDWEGGNQVNMLTDKKVYHSGEVVRARMTFQKLRNVTGTVKWMLINNHIDAFPPRPAMTPPGIYDKEFDIERLPINVSKGRHYFVGYLTYKINPLKEVSYTIRTSCFDVE